VLIVSLAKGVHLLFILRSNDFLKTKKTKIIRILKNPIKLLYPPYWVIVIGIPITIDGLIHVLSGK
jgi:hypothetical protein